MNVMKRPLFRQMGGPATPGPQDMMQQAQMEGAGLAQLLPEVEKATAERSQGIGEQYVTEMMGKLDTAEDFKTVIDAVRGNEKPMDARYQELASYVGPDDARQTPESVLAMVQPTIMMTEEGAMDSGIGDLMRELTTQVDMEMSDGQPTPMGQGVGSMLAANQPPQQFNRGGYVQRMNQGGPPANVNDPVLNEAFYAANRLKPGYGGQTPLPGTTPAASTAAPQLPSLESLYEKSLPMYQKILGRDQAAKDASKSQILFDIARRGLAFAGGVNPDTGQSMAGKPIASQFATAAQTLPGVMGQQIAEQRKLDQGIKLGALEAAQGQYTTALESQLRMREKAAEQAGRMAVEQAKMAGEREIKEMELDAEANKPVKLGATDTLRNPKTGAVIARGVGSPDYEPVRVRFADGSFSEQVFNEKNPEDQRALQALLESSPGSFPVSRDEAVVAPDFSQKRSAIFNDPTLREKIANGNATVQEINTFEQAIREYTRPVTVQKVTDQGVQNISTSTNKLTLETAQFLKKHMPELADEIFKVTGQYTEGRVVKFGLGREPEILTSGITLEEAREFDPIAFDLGIDVFGPDTFVAPLEEEQVFPEIDYGKALGVPGKINVIGNKLYDLIGTTSFDVEAQKAISYLNKFNLNLTMMAAETYPSGRPPVFYLEQFENLKLALQNLTFGDVEAYQSINTLIDVIKSDLVTLRRKSFGPFDDKTKKQAQQGIGVARETLAQAIIIRNGIERGLGLRPQTVEQESSVLNLDRFIK